MLVWMITVLIVLLTPQSTAVQSPTTDPALCNPIFAKFATLHPNDWEQITDPSIKPLIGFQRLIGCHAWIVGWSGGQPNQFTGNPRVLISVAHWDGSDLIALGLPRTYGGKPVVIDDVKEIPKVAVDDSGVHAASNEPGIPNHMPATGTGGGGGTERMSFALALLLSSGLLGLWVRWWGGALHQEST